MTELDLQFRELLDRMTPEQKRFVCECLQDHEEGQCTFDEALSKIETGFAEVTS